MIRIARFREPTSATDDGDANSMKYPFIKPWLVIAAIFLIDLNSAGAQDPDRTTVSVESLLAEMVNRDSVARFPETNFRLKQHSSYNRASTTPDEADGWFNNKDNNTTEKDHNFIRVEERDGKKEWVLMDHEGPGAIVRSWMPWRGQRRPGTDLEIRIYLDGEEEPVLSGNMLGLFDGTGLIPYPLAHQSLRSAVSFFPIPYAKRCKITTTGRPFFYQFTFREYAKDAIIKSFTMADFQAAKRLTKQVGESLLDPQAGVEGDPIRFSTTLESQEEKEVALTPGSAAIRELSVKLGNYDDPTVTRRVVLKIEFDGKETVWCPIGDFFGSGIGLNPFQGWYRTVDEDGRMTCRWVMPYQNAAKVSLVNLGDKPVDAELQVTTGDWKWDGASMYFHSTFRGQYPVATRPYSDWNYITLNGRGVYVGDTLTVMNPVERWWGEGDEKIWVDGEDFPSIFGTGTEDYYAYSWGGLSTDFYQHPFHAQPRCHVYNKLNRKTSEEKNTKGYSTETRSRSLDTMPFSQSLQLDMEVWSWTDCDMAYGVGTYWYGDAETTSNRRPDPDAAVQVPALPDMETQEPATPPKPKTTKEVRAARRLQSEAIEKPNVIIIFVDDMGYADIGPFGAEKSWTPNLNKMADEGIKFTSFYAANCACTASRASLLTGCYPARIGMTRNFLPNSKTGLNPDEDTIADILKKQGYATAAFGKWHLGDLPKFMPLNQGFDEFYGFPYSHDMWRYHPENQRYQFPPLPLYEGSEVINLDVKPEDQLHLTADMTSKAIDFIERNQQHPFFVYLPYPLPHVPLLISEDFKGRTGDGMYGDVVAELDDGVGQILRTLNRCSIDENTLVVFTSDNGPWLMYGNHGGSAKPLKEGKGTYFEGGFRVPCVMRWPAGIPKGAVNDQVCGTIDLLPTIAALAGADPPSKRIDGKDISSLMNMRADASPHDSMFYRQVAVRSGDWKLILPHTTRTSLVPGNDGLPGKRVARQVPLSLFNLRDDIGETSNLAKQNPAVVTRLQGYLQEFKKDLAANKRPIGQ